MISSAGNGLKNSFSGIVESQFNLVRFDKGNGFRIHPDVELALDSNASLNGIKSADRSVKMLHQCVQNIDQSVIQRLPREKTGVIMASSRGASHLLEESYKRFFDDKKLSPKTSPHTTAGIISSYLAQNLGLNGGNFSVSSACTSSLNAIGTGFHLLNSGLFKALVVGGTEAPLTPYTMEILNRAGVTNNNLDPLPLKSFGNDIDDLAVKGMVLGEASGLAVLSKEKTESTVAKILSFQMSGESNGLTGLSPEGHCLAKAIDKALIQANKSPEEIDIISVHGSGTLKGDRAEFNAYKKVFSDQLPSLLISKWATGHTLGAAGILSLAFATESLRTGIIPKCPYEVFEHSNRTSRELSAAPKTALITGLGFGGGASALIIEKV